MHQTHLRNWARFCVRIPASCKRPHSTESFGRSGRIIVRSAILKISSRNYDPHPECDPKGTKCDPKSTKIRR